MICSVRGRIFRHTLGVQGVFDINRIDGLSTRQFVSQAASFRAFLVIVNANVAIFGGMALSALVVDLGGMAELLNRLLGLWGIGLDHLRTGRVHAQSEQKTG